jgi:hypothetical protein
MEKVILVLRRAAADEQWCHRLRGPVAQDLLDLGSVDPPVSGFVSLWTQRSFGDQITSAVGLASTKAFGANENVDTAPTSRILFRSPFAVAS